MLPHYHLPKRQKEEEKQWNLFGQTESEKKQNFLRCGRSVWHSKKGRFIYFQNDPEIYFDLEIWSWRLLSYLNFRFAETEPSKSKLEKSFSIRANFFFYFELETRQLLLFCFFYYEIENNANGKICFLVQIYQVLRWVRHKTNFRLSFQAGSFWKYTKLPKKAKFTSVWSAWHQSLRRPQVS